MIITWAPLRFCRSSRKRLDATGTKKIWEKGLVATATAPKFNIETKKNDGSLEMVFRASNMAIFGDLS